MKGDLETVGLQLAGVILNMTDSVLGGLVQFKESSSSQWCRDLSATRSSVATQFHFCLPELLLHFILFFFVVVVLQFYFIFKLYIIVLVLPNIKMNPPQVYMCSPS